MEYKGTDPFYPREFIRAWCSRGSGDGQFYQPESLAIGTNGNIYVVDSRNHRIQQFSREGIFIRTWGGWKLRRTSGSGHSS